MGDNLFEGLPPPSNQQLVAAKNNTSSISAQSSQPPPPPPAPPAPVLVLKSALKRPKPIDSNPAPQETAPEDTVAPGKRLRFKTTTDASEKQLIEAMEKIASHIKNPSKFAKASKLAIQLIQAGSVKPETSDHFFAILEAAMSSETSCTDPSVRADYHALFSAAQDAADCLNKKQKHQLAIWRMRAVVANDLFTDDSFVFSKSAAQVKEAITNLPVATEDDDIEEAEALQEETETNDKDSKNKHDPSSGDSAEENLKSESDPFGLDALLCTTKKEDRAKGKKGSLSKTGKEDEEENKRFLKGHRESLITCLEIAARRYKLAWCQTGIDILVKHAFDNVGRFTSRQRDAIGKLWASIREQQTRRRQGKSVNGKLDVTAFEHLQEKYSTEKISIRHSVGGSGDRKAQQWLG
ncbi:uncharacterized protein LOC126671979 [Mercurialis annua]|uniref:uncharacterized protein LOC126671979 n=1 Tax=Mercurialis annua TaxID=3986 RepID=UPI0021602CDA|nr:uncharacterized protein LOC126671979 [Mercurialis annua]